MTNEPIQPTNPHDQQSIIQDQVRGNERIVREATGKALHPHTTHYACHDQLIKDEVHCCICTGHECIQPQPPTTALEGLKETLKAIELVVPEGLSIEPHTLRLGQFLAEADLDHVMAALQSVIEQERARAELDGRIDELVKLGLNTSLNYSVGGYVERRVKTLEAQRQQLDKGEQYGNK